MLQNDYLIAKIGVGTAENELSEVEILRAEMRAEEYLATYGLAVEVAQGRGVIRGRQRSIATTHHSFRGSFSAVSAPIFASK